MEDMYFFMFDVYTVVSIVFDLQLPPLSPNIFCFSNHKLAVFFFFLLHSLLSPVLQQHHGGDNFFLIILPIAALDQEK
jgi:hypothetical protein